MLLAPLSNLEFPSWRSPGFDPTHLAAGAKVQYSGVAATGQNAFINLLTGAATTSAGTIGNYIERTGPTVAIFTATSYLTAAGASIEPSSLTMGCIFIPNASVATGAIFCNNDNNTTATQSSVLQVRALVVYLQTPGSGTISSGITLTTGVPYFIAVSYNASVANFVVVNLNNGVTTTASVSGAHAFVAMSGYNSYGIGGGTGASTYMNGFLAAVMYSINNYLSLPQLLVWAADPWAFWYPDDDLDYRYVGLSSGGLSFAGLSRASFRAVSAFAGAQTMTALGGSRARAQGASAQAAAITARSASVSDARPAQTLAAAFAAASSAKAPSRASPTLKSAFAGLARAIVQARGTQGTGAFFSATGAMRAAVGARGAPALAASLAARALTSAAARGLASTGALLFAASGLAQASVRAEAALLAMVHVVVKAAPVLKAPITIRSLAVPARMRLLKAISTIRNLKAPS